MMHPLRCAFVLVAALSSGPAQAQPPAAPGCSMPQPSPGSREASLFTPAQAVQLADIVWRSQRIEVDLVGDPALVGYLQAMADRMVAAAGAQPVRVAMIDIPEVNAMTVPGRIYVARKLIAFAANEDEVAGVIAHEVGHGIAGDFERNMSVGFRKLLNVTAVGDDRDIEDRYHRLLDAVLEGRRFDWSASDDAEQENADRLAVWLMARVGYAPQAYESVWNRLNELRSRSGSWLTDLVGMTSPAAKRLRVTRAAVETLPASCMGTRTTTEKQFADWRAAVIAASRTTAAAAAPPLRGLRTERKLTPELRSAVSFLKFSPDGRHVLGQDDGSVYLFTREGLKFTHRIDAPDARHAQFAPNSSSVVFYDRNYRVQRWSVATGAREWVRELVMTRPCAQSELSPDGAYLACVTSEFDVRLYEVATGSVVFNKEFFIIDKAAAGIVIGPSPGDDKEFEVLKVRFSPDGRYLVLARNAVAMAIDLATRTTISLPGSVRDRIGLSFAFLADGRIVGLHLSNPDQSGIVTFPEGKIVSKINLGRHALSAPASGDRYLLIGQVPDYEVGLVDLAEGKLKGGSKTPGLDMFDDHYVAELRSGEIAIYKMGVTEPVSFATVPSGPLGWLRAASVDTDFTTLAASQNSRGGTWDLGTGKGLLTRAFRASYSEGTIAYLDFPAEGATQRAIVRFEPSSQGAQVLVGIQEPMPQGGNPPRPAAASVRISSQEYRDVALAGTFLVASKVASGSQPNTTVVLEALTGRQVWARPQPKSWPAVVLADPLHNTVSIAWAFGQAEGRAIVDAHPELARRADAQSAKKGDLFVLEVLDLATGAPRGRYLTTARPGGVFLTERDLVVSLDPMNRTLVHSLSTGERLGRAFGRYLDVDSSSGRVVMATGRRELTICVLPRLEPVTTFTFSSDVAFARLGDAGKRLLVMTAGQTVYTLDIGSKQ
jgi:WD40 repeat protein